jgi:MYXO-CTERM domain-containing protein
MPRWQFYYARLPLAARFACVPFALGVPATALAWDSEPQDLTFHDQTDVFSAAEYDTGPLPGGSPLTVRFYIASEGGAITDMDATSELTWPDALTHTITGVPGSGWFRLVTDLTMQAEVGIDLWGYTGTFPVWSQALYMHDDATFDPLLLPDGSTPAVDLASDGPGIDPITYNISLFTGVDLQFTLNVFPRATAHLAGISVATGDSIQTSESQLTDLDVPEENPGWIDLSSTYLADLAAHLQIVLVPGLDVCSPFGCFNVVTFEVPVDLVVYDEAHPFEAENYSHPLPSIVPPDPTHDFGEVAVGNLANATIPLADQGTLDLEGYAYIEGDAGAFTVYPTYFYATPGNEDGVVVTFAPTATGDTTALLVIESNDPVRPRIEIPLRGTAFSEDPIPDDTGRAHGEIKTCSCASGGAGGSVFVLALAAIVLRRRR